MTVSHGRIGKQHALFCARQFGEFLRTERIEVLLGAVDDLALDARNDRLGSIGVRLWATLGFGMAIDGDIGEIGEHLLARSWRFTCWSSSGVVSMNRVV